MNSSVHSFLVMGYRSGSFPLVRFMVVLVLLVLLSLPVVVLSQTRVSQTPNYFKTLLSATTVQFSGLRGEGAMDCQGRGMCRAHMLGKAESRAVNHAASVTAEGRFTMQNGRLHFILTGISSERGTASDAMSIADVHSFPFDAKTELPREIARTLGFVGVQVHKSRYPESAPGVFPVHATYSVGLQATARPTTSDHSHLSRGGAVISFEILRPMVVSVFVVKADGERVATVLTNVRMEGSETPQRLVWNGEDSTGRLVGSSNYHVEVRCTLPESGMTFAESVALSDIVVAAQR
jgi:hypothetical protein